MRCCLIALACTAMALPAAAQSAAGELGWLAGCWERRSGELMIEEQWQSPRGGVLLGMSRTVRGDSVIEYEFLRIYPRAGGLVLAASPSGQPPAEFTSRGAQAREVVFENPAHDFPQRIRYRAVGADSLIGEIEGARNGQHRRIAFPYARTACPAPPHSAK